MTKISCRLFQIRQRGLGVHEIPIGMIENALQPADEILDEGFDAILRHQHRNKVMHERVVLDAAFVFQIADGEEIILQPPRSPEIHQT
jgi:hypothetical protein